MTWSSGFFCLGFGYLELPERRTAWTVLNCEQFQTVTLYSFVCWVLVHTAH